MKKLFILFACMLMNVSFATTIKDISACGKNTTCQESTAKQFVTEHPDSDKGHYVLAQIEANKGDFSYAANELQQAEKISPNLTPYPSFASNLNSYNKLKNKIEHGARSNQSVSHPTETVSTNPYSSSINNTPTTIPTTINQPVTQHSSGSSFTGFFIFIILLIIGIVTFLYFVNKNKQKEMKQQQTKQLGQLNEMMEKLNEVILASKTESFSNLEKEATNLNSKLITFMQDVKANNLISDYQLSLTLNRVSLMKKTADSGKDWVEPKESPTPLYNSTDANSNQQQYHSNNTSSQTVPTFQPAPTVVVQQSSNNGLLTGLFLGEMLSSNNHHDRDSVTINNNYQSRNDDDDNYSSRRSSSRNDDLDLVGSNNSDSGSIDFGGSDSSSSDSGSSVDFGGDDN